MSHKPRMHSFGLFLFAIAACTASGSCYEATLYDDINYGGATRKVSFTGCINVYDDFNDRASSIKTNGCIRLWEHGDCTGRKVDISAPGMSNLQSHDFNDKLSSVSDCRLGGGLPEDVDIILHLNGASDLSSHAERMKQMMREWFPFIQNQLNSPGYKPVPTIHLYFDVKDNGIYASGNEIHIPIEYVRNNKEDTGVFIHEMTHVIHQANNCPGWVVEGMAEYTRRWWYEPYTTRKKPTDPELNNPYLGDWLLVYLNTVMKRPIMYALNRACQTGTWRDSLVKDLTGRDEKEWWRIMIGDDNFPWKVVR